MPLEAGFCSRLAGLFLGLLQLNLTEFPVQLPAPLLVPLFALGQLQVFQLALVMALFEGCPRRPQLGEPLVVLGERAIEPGELGAAVLDRILVPARLRL